VSATETEKTVYAPTDWQLEDLAYLEDLPKSANWSEMGCYKTTTVQWLAERLLREIENPKVLIITTRSGKGTYFQTIPEVLPDWELYNLKTTGISIIINGHEIPLGKELVRNAEKPAIILTHYNVFSRRKEKKLKKEDPTENVLEMLIKKSAKKKKPPTLLDKTLATHWDLVVLDEAHRIKGPNTGWTKEIHRLRAKHKHIMTGTGFINNPSEIWSLLYFLDRKQFSSYWKFRERYCEESNDSGYRQIVGPRQETKEEFRQLVRGFGPRRTKIEVFKDLPHPLYTPQNVELNDIQREMYDGIRNELFTLDQNGEPLYAPNVLAALTRLRQVCVATPEVVARYFDEKLDKPVTKIKLVEPSSKLDALMEVIEGLEWDEERKDQLVVFSNFKDPIDLAIQRFEQAGISYIHMQESDNDQVRYQKWAIDFPKKEHQVFICTLQLGGESITLTSASTCVFLDRSWSPKDNSQGVARIWRPGQKEVANIININADNTVDWVIEERVNKKEGWFKQIFGEKNTEI
jgi:SNF2 family DNA or RNA helicase